jgi:hypothetical protein
MVVVLQNLSRLLGALGIDFENLHSVLQHIAGPANADRRLLLVARQYPQLDIRLRVSETVEFGKEEEEERGGGRGGEEQQEEEE